MSQQSGPVPFELPPGWSTLPNEMRALVETTDWSATAVGPQDGWSASLRLASDMVLASAFPMALRWGEDFVLIYNDAYRVILGDKHPRALGRPVREVWPEVWPRIEAAHLAIRDRRSASLFAEDMTMRVQRHGSLWEDACFTLGYSPVTDPTAPSGIGGVLVAAVETTGRVFAEAALRASEEAAEEDRSFLRDILRSSGEAFYAVDREGVTTLCNHVFLRMIGFTHEDEAIGRKLHDVIHHTHPHGARYDKSDCPIYICASTAEPAHVEDESFYRLDGAAFPVEYWVSPIFRDGVHHGAICTFVDVTERRASQEALTEQSRILKTLNETGVALTAERDIETLVQRVTDAGLELTGAQFGAFFYNVVDAGGDGLMLYTLAGADRSAFEHFGVPRATALLQPTFRGESIVRSDDVLADPRYGRSAPHHGMPDGHLPVRSYLAVPVVSRSGEVIGSLFYGHGRTSVFTAAHEQLIAGIAGQAAIGIDNARLLQTTQRLNDTLEARVLERTAELEQAQEALRQAQKMEAVGQLTGGIAHDFNNMLAVVMGSLELLARRLPNSDERAQRYVDAATDAARRAALLTQRLLAFSRQQPLEPKAIDVNTLVEGMSDLLHHSLGVDVRLDTVLAAGLWHTHADPNQLENIVLNLAVNARDAMPGGGRLTIETLNAHIEERHAAAHAGLAAGHYVLIAVTDTGTGMAPGVVERAFDPFYTTKPVGKGTGLGLSQVYGFVKQSGGHVEILTKLGQGTTIKIYLPRLLGGEEVPGSVIEIAPLPLGDAREVVLIVEDEPGVRQFSVDALTGLGYHVLEADGAAAALRLLDAHPDILLMFTDVVMPETNGARLAEAARARRPELKILFTTGYTRDAVVHDGVLDPGVDLIGKPFTLEALAAKVRAVLDAS